MIMSVPPPYSQQRSSSEQVEDCRDYLRTGRCKYGASCKYYHPPNVQSGGGMKMPIDPSEPMFPVRPNEPPCQYYMKHGTCKFGQACKFNHPPQPPLQAVVNGRGQTVVMNVAPRQSDATQLVLNPVGTDSNGSMMLQFLPQRPDEPDCIYFLKNGRCKYGATCRYHHPINFIQQQQRRVQDESNRVRNRVQTVQDQYNRVQNVQYVVQQVPAGYAQANQTGQTHLSADGQLTFLNFDAAPLQGFQPVPIVSSADGTASYAFPIADQGSSASSIASTFDNSGSTLGNRNNGSAGNLNAYITSADNFGQQQNSRAHVVPILHNSASDSNIARRNRSTSYGSASDASYYDSTATTASMSRNTSVGSWRNEHTSGSGDHSNRRAPSSQYATIRQDGGMPIASGGGVDYAQSHMRGNRVPVSSSGMRPRRVSRRGQGAREGGDEGFTMMTSALLNLLDTPEEVGAAYDEGDPRLMYAAAGYPSNNGEIDPSYFEQLSLTDSGSNTQQQINVQGQVHPSWPPNSNARDSSAEPLRTNEGVQMIPPHNQHHGHPSPNSHHHSGNDVGLYLP